MGCVDNLLIDKIFVNGTRRCTLTKEELILQLGGFEETLEIHGMHFNLINLIKSVMMKKWRITLEVNTSEGKQTISTIKVNREILQGDSFYGRLFTLALNRIAYGYFFEIFVYCRDNVVKFRKVCWRGTQRRSVLSPT